MQGDADAAYKLARAHSKGLLTPSVGHVLKPDHLTALVWYAKAYELGNNKALRYLFEAYYYGIKVKPDRKAAMGYLEHAARLKQQWAMMIKAAWSEDSDPSDSLELLPETSPGGQLPRPGKTGPILHETLRKAGQLHHGLFLGFIG